MIELKKKVNDLCEGLGQPPRYSLEFEETKRFLPSEAPTSDGVRAAQPAEERVQKRNQRLALLSESLGHLVSSHDPERIVRDLFPKVAAHLGVDTYFNYMVNREGDALTLHSYAGISNETAKAIERLEFGQAICGRVAQTHQPIVAMEIQTSDYDKAALVRSCGIQAYACNPLMSGGRFLGTLSFASRTRARFDEDELEFIRTVSRYVAIAMERAQAEERLQQSEQRLGGILRQATVGVAQTDVTGRFVLVNDRYCEMVGRSREELLGLRMQDITHPEDVPGNLVLFQRTSQTGEDFEIEKRYVRPDGSVVWVHNSVYAVRYASGRPEYIVAMSLDITDRKQAEEVLQQLNLELEQRVAQRTAELLSTVAQREKLQEQLLQAQKMESIGTLAGGIAHDFNNLLNIIMSYTLVIQHNAHQGKLSDALDVIKDTVKRAATLVQQLLSIARKTESRFEEINLNTMLEKLQILIRETFPRTIEISLELDFGIPPLRLDQNQVHQVLLNLCVNARDAMPRGGKLLVQTSVIGGHALRQTFHEVKEDRYVCIRVTDTGTGMDERTKSRIFEPFFTTKEPGQGTGLGLSIVYGIVANHGGFIDVESTTGQGTTFSVYLPILPAQVTETHEPAAEGNEAEDFVAEGETILFVDDEEKQLHLMREFLERKGYRVLTARDGIEAVDLHARYKEKIALTILDLGLPKLDGWKAFQRMKQIQPGLSALFATGFLSSKIEAEMKRCQLPGIISKPYRLNDVLEKISVAIREQRTGRWSKELRAKSKT